MVISYNKFADFKKQDRSELPYEIKRVDNVIGQNLKF